MSRNCNPVLGVRQIYDISVTLGKGAVTYPGDPPFSKELVSNPANGDSCLLSQLSMSSHAGTHIDAPAHFIRDGKTIDAYKPEDFLLTAHVALIIDKEMVKESELGGVVTSPGDAILFKTENSRSRLCGSGVFSEKFVHLSVEAADWCAHRRLALVGIDYVTIDAFGDDEFPVHHKLLGAGILVLEGLDLSDIRPGTYMLCCAPLKIKGAEAAPARAFLWR